jgi:NAD(P)-dependent dehydrogenase (short-subunit alcohol dehydrogenase family)
MKSLEGQTALIAGGGAALGRAVALALAARGVRIVVTGRDEKALGRTVGEVVHGGGKARHVVGDVRAPEQLGQAVARALEVFGRLDILVATEVAEAKSLFEAAARLPVRPARLLLAGPPAAAPSTLVREVAEGAGLDGSTCNAIELGPGVRPEDADEDVGALAVFLCSRAAARITGQTILLGRTAEA